MRLFMNILICILFFSCGNSKQDHQTNSTKTETDTPDIPTQISVDTLLNLTPNNKKLSILELNKRILNSLKSKEYLKIADYIHPIKGVRFLEGDRKLVLTTDKFIQALNTNTKLNFGLIGPSDYETILTLSSYCNKYIYNKDFLKATKVNLNKIMNSCNGESLTNGVNTTITNYYKKDYPNSEFVENYFKPDDNGICIDNLCLFFEKYNSQFYLVAFDQIFWEP